VVAWTDDTVFGINYIGHIVFWQMCVWSPTANDVILNTVCPYQI